MYMANMFQIKYHILYYLMNSIFVFSCLTTMKNLKYLVGIHPMQEADLSNAIIHAKEKEKGKRQKAKGKRSYIASNI